MAKIPRTVGTEATGSSPWVVLKFGGTSVSTAKNWETIFKLLCRRQADGLRPLVVHSALATVSNALEHLLQSAVTGPERPGIEQVKLLHFELATELGIDGPQVLNQHFSELEQLLAGVHLIREASPRIQARIMAIGELLATRLGSAYLQKQGLLVTWLDARDLLRSVATPGAKERGSYLAATCDFDREEGLDKRLAAIPGVVLTQGFIASNARGECVLLGRGGSDTSAAYFAAKLQAVGMEIWTDVPGMFSANPKIVPGARLLHTLSYEEAQEIASTGGLVLHPRSISPCRRHGIPLRILCTTHPELAGTLVTVRARSDAPRVKAILGRSRITLVSMETLGMWHEVGFLADAFRCFSDLGLSIDLVSTSESNVTVTLDRGVNPIDVNLLIELESQLGRLCKVTIIEDVEIVSLVGQKIRAALHEIGPALEAFQEYRIHLVSQSATDLNLSFVVEEGQANRLIQKLHGTLVNPGPDDPLFGATLGELQGDIRQLPADQEPWWILRRQELVAIGVEQGAAYVYHLATVRAAARRLKSLKSVDRLFFAMKANNSPDVLRALYEEGLNFECVSPREIARVLDIFPDINPSRILFTPNFAPRTDYEFGLSKGVWLTLDNLHPLRHWSELFKGRELFLRIDTGHARGHHQHVQTAGSHSKFGIPLFELEEARTLLRACGAKVVGLHAHVGSGILSPTNWQEVGRELVIVAQDFKDLRYLDLGGGLGVPEKVGHPPLDMAAVDAGISEIRGARSGLEIWLEPGRYLVAEAGVLVTTVTQTKGKGQVQYVGVSTGMNSLIRPALYGAFHEIVNLSRWGEVADQMVTIVGPICESGDRLGADRFLPTCVEGDVLAIANAGAYGFVMSSSYNLRAPAVEISL